MTAIAVTWGSTWAVITRTMFSSFARGRPMNGSVVMNEGRHRRVVRAIVPTPVDLTVRRWCPIGGLVAKQPRRARLHGIVGAIWFGQGTDTVGKGRHGRGADPRKRAERREFGVPIRA